MTRPARGEQYAFQVDLDACSGCKACVTACHSLNGLEPGESWRSVGLLLDRHPIATPGSSVAVQHVTTACHHCVDPACLNGCPVLAYEKDAATGIVRHLDDQCIGCSYCTLMCPYEVPRYSSRLGIVRKCDLCYGRLAADEAPACVQGCPNEAIRVTLVDASTLESNLRRPTRSTTPSPSLVPDAPDSSFTVPTTRYVSASGRADRLVAADRTHALPAAAHTPLTLFLVLSQASVGLAATATIAAGFGRLSTSSALLTALVLQLLALAVATAHLGQPLRAWRAFLGWRKSWFSREVLVFGAYTAALAVSAMGNLGLALPETVRSTALVVLPWLGLIGVFTSAMIYVATRRAFWSASPTFARFLGTVLILGGASLASPGGALFLVILGLVAKLPAELFPLFRRNANAASETERTRSLLLGVLRPVLAARLALAGLGVACFAVSLLATSITGAPLALLGAASLLAGELIERHLFFVAVAPQRMPGAVPS
jgi:Fe-S-cluster-containing dehydrogenase component/DMSO reductase anchor subunit